MHSDSKVFGIGLSRTGTTSLNRALEILGIRLIHYPHDQITYRELTSGQYRLTILNSFDAITDITAAPFFAQFDKAFPNSRFIITLRDPYDWAESMRRHFEHLERYMAARPEFKRFTEFICACTYGTLTFQRDRLLYAYEQHHRNVSWFFRGRKADLLTVNICEDANWVPLCDFLGCNLPEVRFPHQNRGANAAPINDTSHRNKPGLG